MSKEGNEKQQSDKHEREQLSETMLVKRIGSNKLCISVFDKEGPKQGVAVYVHDQKRYYPIKKTTDKNGGVIAKFKPGERTIGISVPGTRLHRWVRLSTKPKW